LGNNYTEKCPRLLAELVEHWISDLSATRHVSFSYAMTNSNDSDGVVARHIGELLQHWLNTEAQDLTDVQRELLVRLAMSDWHLGLDELLAAVRVLT
jgi:hypothetical protein